jgi:hypothetical protein
MYLSTAVAKRLKQRRIHVQDRSLVRYINHDESTGGLQIYSARSFDFLDSSRTRIDQLVSVLERYTGANALLIS